MSWVPPSGGPPIGPPAAAPQPALPSAPPAAVATPPVAAPSAQPGTTAAAEYQRASPLTGGQIGFAVVTAIVVCSLIGGTGTGISVASSSNTGTPPDEPLPAAPATGDYGTLAEGDPSAAVAIDPTVCPTSCFDQRSVTALILENSWFDDAQLPGHDVLWGTQGNRTTADLAQAANVEEWDNTGFGPVDCFVTWADEPIVEFGGTDVDTGLIAPITRHWSPSSPGTELTQSIRFFDTSESAVAYMGILSAGVDACPRYEDPNGYPIDRITAEPAIAVPDNVAAVGFVDTQAGLRTYAFDMQRANIVIRTVVHSDGGIDDDLFRTLMEAQARTVGNATPKQG